VSFTKLKERACELYEECLSEDDVSRDDIREFAVDFRQNNTVDHVVSIEKHLSDDLVYDWDILGQYTAANPIELLRLKAEQKYCSKLEKYLVEINKRKQSEAE